jgi:hypothetical protein
MRRKLIVLSLALVSVLALSSSASAARFRAFRGETSAGTRIGFLIRIGDDGRMSMKELTYRADLACEDSSTIGYWSSWSFGGVGHRLQGRRLRFDNVFYGEALHVTGVFRARTADGTFESTWASLTEAEEAQLCSTGNLTWTAERVSRDRLPRLGSLRGQEMVHRADDGTARRVSSI